MGSSKKVKRLNFARSLNNLFLVIGKKDRVHSKL